MMLLLLDSALRSLLLGLLVWALLKLVRMRDTCTETIIWNTVLVVALSMPLLNHCLPGLVVAVPHMSAALPESVTALRPTGPGDAWPTLAWSGRYGPTCLLGAYLLGLMLCLIRLAVGLVLTLRLYLRALPVNAQWAQGRRIRATAALRSPASLARVILLPADYHDWSAAKREAVLAHETAHIARGDFFVQLAASLHCAFFWFSPFAWWLQTKLAEIAETASDDAAIERLNDRVTYAEILLDVACRAQPTPSIVAMAKGPFIQQRVERILAEAPSRNLGAPLRLLVIGSLTLLALTLASAKAAIDPIPMISLSDKASPAKAEGKSSSSPNSPAGTPGTTHAPERLIPPAHHVSEPPGIAAARNEEVSYNPRALLDPEYAPARPYVPASTIVHDGKTFYIRSTERPVAEVSAADGSYRPAH
jgi:beta-lactamase regulating signal transducer with metallopeptidase domain